VRLEVLTAVAVKIAVFWDVMPCSLANVYRNIGGRGSSTVKMDAVRSSLQRIIKIKY
jgi:hypothetical protein